MAETSATIGKARPWDDPRAEAYINLDRVTKKFDEFVAVDHVSLKIYKQELFCLLGGSGCGKSTLLRMLAGFEMPTGGDIFIDGVNMADIPPYERPVNMMFQSYALFPHMTVEQNVGFGLRQERRPRAEIARRVEDMLDLVALRAFARRKPHQLSGGQRQRVALARSLIKQPKVLLLDEPLAALDKKLRERTQFELINIQEKLGVTFIVVTHDQSEAMTLATRIGVMNKGHIVQIGTPDEIYEFPNSRFVSDFIGSVNIFDGRIIEDESDHVRIACDDVGATVFIDHGVSAAPGAHVGVAVRPEKIIITRARPHSRDNCLQGTVDEIAYMGDLSIYLVRLDGGRIVRVTQPNLVRGASDRITWEEKVYLHWHPSNAVVLTE